MFKYVSQMSVYFLEYSLCQNYSHGSVFTHFITSSELNFNQKKTKTRNRFNPEPPPPPNLT